MYETIIINEFNKHIVLTTEDIQKSNNNCLNRAIMNTELKRMCDKGEIYRIGRGVYTRCRNTKWGKILPAENDIVQEFYYTAGGYLSDVSYLNRIGITTQIPAVKYITTNKFRHKLYVLNNTVIKKPKIKITHENCAYLQLLDGIETYLLLTSYDLLHSKDFQCRQKVQKMAEILRFSASFVCKGADFLI